MCDPHPPFGHLLPEGEGDQISAFGLNLTPMGLRRAKLRLGSKWNEPRVERSTWVHIYLRMAPLVWDQTLWGPTPVSTFH